MATNNKGQTPYDLIQENELQFGETPGVYAETRRLLLLAGAPSLHPETRKQRPGKGPCSHPGGSTTAAGQIYAAVFDTERGPWRSCARSSASSEPNTYVHVKWNSRRRKRIACAVSYMSADHRLSMNVLGILETGSRYRFM